jgi:hypothetical protein
MPIVRSSSVGAPPVDAAADAVAASVTEILHGAVVQLHYSPAGSEISAPVGATRGSAIGEGPDGWQLRVTLDLDGPAISLVPPTRSPLKQILKSLPAAALRVATAYRPTVMRAGALTPAIRRAMRDSIVIDMLSHQLVADTGEPAPIELIAATLEFLIELSGTRVESHDLTHGVIITDVLVDTPRLRVNYPADLRAAKRAPLLFDGQQSVLVIDRQGRARTELQYHRIERLIPGATPFDRDQIGFTHAGSLVAEATRHLGGLGFFLRADRTIWAFAGGSPLLIRRAEHWTAFPLELANAINDAIGGGAAAADIVVGAAFIISSQRHGAILAIVDDAKSLDGAVALKDRYDMRDTLDPDAMQIETRLHHLIDAQQIDAQTLARLAALDGATIVDREGNLIAYGAIVTSSDSQHEGARTAAAKTLSHDAAIVLKVSVDGDITVFREGIVVARLLG